MHIHVYCDGTYIEQYLHFLQFTLVKKKEQGKNVVVQEGFKIKAVDGSHKNMLLQESACVLALVFDNQYSYFRSKKIRFAYAVCDDKQIARANNEVRFLNLFLSMHYC